MHFAFDFLLVGTGEMLYPITHLNIESDQSLWFQSIFRPDSILQFGCERKRLYFRQS
ncbi:2901_t:CDS:2 [Cetraspora pellucida]|uniref:2901_t:CDS:1 n=1 Tax=Cetraspora pellucida TaxID=1433469 RepID=A0A9N9C1B5_9GLOM|nr:2901_t:CDS:2 [Cetraspora pellucida]